MVHAAILHGTYWENARGLARFPQDKLGSLPAPGWTVSGRNGAKSRRERARQLLRRGHAQENAARTKRANLRPYAKNKIRAALNAIFFSFFSAIARFNRKPRG